MKKRKAETVVTAGIWVGMAALAVYIVIKGLALEKSTLEHMLYQVQQQAIEMGIWGDHDRLALGEDRIPAAASLGRYTAGRAGRDRPGNKF